MFGKRLILILVATAALALPLIWADGAAAESGCHRTGGSTTTSSPND